MNYKNIVIFGGGTISHIRSHLALSAPAYGSTARKLDELCKELIPNMDRRLILTKMADNNSKIETNQDIEAEVKNIIENLNDKIVFFSCAMCDFDGNVDNEESGKYSERLKTSDYARGQSVNYPFIGIQPSKKVINMLRHDAGGRKDIFLVGFKTTCGATLEEQYIAGLNLVKKGSCNLVLANDTKTRLNMVITPEESKYHVTTDRDEALRKLVEIVYLRSHLTFTRSTVVAGEMIPWNSELIPSALRTCVDYCVKRGAYKEFNGATVGHFAAKIAPTTFLTSIRKSNFNDIEKLGLVKVETDGPDRVIAYGAKPSVGGQSQRIVFEDHPDCDCILHFHTEKKINSLVPVISQKEFECGSMECGRNTSKGLTKFGNLYAVYLDHHGPNIVFNKSINPQEVIDFIEENFDLDTKTGGPVKLEHSEINN